MMMNFSMNYRKRAPISIIQVAQVMDNTRFMPRQVARVPVAKIVESHVMKPVVKDEKHEIRENMENREKKIIIFTIGEEDEEKDAGDFDGDDGDAAESEQGRN